MAIDIHDEEVIRDFVLGELSPEDRDRVEDAFMLDGDYFDEVCGVENELVLRYVRNELSQSLRDRFVRALALSPALREQVDEAKALTSIASTERETTRPWWTAITSPSRLGLASIAAAVVLVAAIVAIRSNRSHSSQTATVNAHPPALSEESGPVVSLFLEPNVRRVEAKQQNATRLPAGASRLELSLVVLGVRATNLKAQVAQARGADLPVATDPIVRETPAGTTVTWSVPASLLPPGDYLLTITGDVAGRERGAVATRLFRVIE